MSKIVAVREKTNEGLSGAPNRKVGPAHGQGTDGSGEHDTMATLLGRQIDAYHAKGSDWPVKDVDAADGQSGPKYTAEGKDALATLSQDQEGPRHAEDGGPGKGAGTPSGWSSGERSARIAAAFPIEQNKGEGESEGGQTSIDSYVDLEDGQTCVDSYKQSPFKETPIGYGN